MYQQVDVFATECRDDDDRDDRDDDDWEDEMRGDEMMVIEVSDDGFRMVMKNAVSLAASAASAFGVMQMI